LRGLWRAKAWRKQTTNQPTNMKNEKKKTEKIDAKKYPIKARSWVNSDATSYGGAMLRGWYKANPQFIDENS